MEWNDWEPAHREGDWYRQTADGLTSVDLDKLQHSRGWRVGVNVDTEQHETETRYFWISEGVADDEAKSQAMAFMIGMTR